MRTQTPEEGLQMFEKGLKKAIGEDAMIEGKTVENKFSHR